MFKKSLFAVTLASFSIGCAHNPPPRKAPSTVTSVRLDEAIRSKCKINSGATPVFDFSSSELSPEAKATLDTVASCFTDGQLKGKGLRLIGFTDPLGSRSDNYELGLERAEAVARFLERNGVKRVNMIVSSRGEQGASPDRDRWPADRIVDLSIAN